MLNTKLSGFWDELGQFLAHPICLEIFAALIQPTDELDSVNAIFDVNYSLKLVSKTQTSILV